MGGENMAVVKIPYSKGFIEAQIDDARLVGVLESKAHHDKP